MLHAESAAALIQHASVPACICAPWAVAVNLGSAGRLPASAPFIPLHWAVGSLWKRVPFCFSDQHPLKALAGAPVPAWLAVWTRTAQLSPCVECLREFKSSGSSRRHTTSRAATGKVHRLGDVWRHIKDRAAASETWRTGNLPAVTVTSEEWQWERLKETKRDK